MEGDAANLRRYLLGSLSASETEEIDLMVLGDEEFAEEISFAEAELMEDYLDAELSKDEQASFRLNFLISERREEELRELAFLKKRLRAEAAESPVEASAVEVLDGFGSGESFFSRIARALSLDPRSLALGAGALAIILIVVGLFWLGGSRGSALEREYAELNAEDLSSIESYRELSQVNLTSETFRQGGSSQAREKDTLTDRILFRLGLPAGQERPGTFTAYVVREGVPVFSLDNAKVYRNENGGELRLLLPKSIFQSGRYQIKVKPQADGREETFAFVIN